MLSSPYPARCGWTSRASAILSRTGTAGALLSVVSTGASAQVASPKPAEPPPAEIVVQGRRVAVRQTLQGTPYSVGDSAQGEAGSAVEVLNALPSVRVAPDGSVSVRGSDSVRIFVNGRPSAALNGAARGAALEAIAGGSIASVEVLTNPSVRDDANGGTILNIVMKKPRTPGASGKGTATVGDRGRRTLSLNAGLNRGRLKASLDAGLRQDVRLQTVTDERRLLGRDGSTTARFVTLSRYTPTRSRSASLAGSLTYALPTGADLGVEASVSRGTPINQVFEAHRDFGAGDTLQAVYARTRAGTYVNADHDISLFYREKAADGTAALSVEAQHSLTALRSDRPFVTTWTLPDRPAEGRRVVYRTRTAIDRVAADYDLPLASGWRLRTGGAWQREATRTATGATAFDLAAPKPLALPPLAQFDGVQRIAVLHGAVTFHKGILAAEAGSRLEDVAVTVTRLPEIARVERRLGGFAHRLSITRETAHDHAAVRLSRSRERIDPRDLSPIVVTVDPQRQSRGNPLLRPQDVTTAEVEYGIDSDCLRASATLFLRRTDRLVGEFYDVAGDGILLRTAANTGTRRSVGGEATVGGPIGKTIKYSLTATLRRDRIDTADGFARTLAGLTGYSLQASVDWEATKRDKLHVDADRRGPELFPQGRRSGTGAVNLVWRHVLSPRLTASLTARGLVQDGRVRTVIRNVVTVTDTDWVTDTRAVLFGVSVTR